MYVHYLFNLRQINGARRSAVLPRGRAQGSDLDLMSPRSPSTDRITASQSKHKYTRAGVAIVCGNDHRPPAGRGAIRPE